MKRAWTLLWLLLLACERPATRASAPAAPAVTPTAAVTPHGDWVNDAPERAFEEAREQRRLVLADLWAPWCHTCLSMQELVLNETQVPELAGVVRLAVDTERSENEQFLQRYPAVVWPTFYLIDPQTREVRGRWLGGASPEQLRQWLRDASGSANTAEALLRRADELASQRRLNEAEATYRQAVAAAQSNGAQRSRALVALISALLKQNKRSECLQLALDEAANLPPSVSAVDFSASALSCADSPAEAAQARAARQALEPVLARDCSTRAPGVSADDQADACDNLREVRAALGDPVAATRAAEQTLAIIEAACAGASPEMQAIYDWHRSSTLVFLGRSEEAIALLEDHERDLPQSYNPPHYLARIYRDQKRWSEGLAAIERALAKAYGPRRIGLLGVKATLLQGAGHVAEARGVLEQQLADYRALPVGQQRPDAEDAVEQRLRELTQ